MLINSHSFRAVSSDGVDCERSKLERVLPDDEFFREEEEENLFLALAMAKSETLRPSASAVAAPGVEQLRTRRALDVPLSRIAPWTLKSNAAEERATSEQPAAVVL